jgi:hypothetical protein
MAKIKQVNKARSLAMKASWAKRRNSPMREQARKREVQPKELGEPKFWILWAPASHKPPKVRFGTLEHVRNVADIMVDKYHQDIYVMQSVELHKIGKAEVIAYTAGPKKEAPVSIEKEVLEKIKAQHELRRIPPPLFRQGQPWDQDQDNYLTGLWYNGMKDVRLLAERLGRSELAIEYRLEALMLRPRNDG